MATLAFDFGGITKGIQNTIDQGKSAVKGAVDSQTSALANELKEQARAFLAEQIIERDKQVKTTIATGVMIGVGGCVALILAGYLLAKK